MQISEIENEKGDGKKIMSKFPLKDVKPNYFMAISGNSYRAELRVLMYK